MMNKTERSRRDCLPMEERIETKQHLNGHTRISWLQNFPFFGLRNAVFALSILEESARMALWHFSCFLWSC